MWQVHTQGMGFFGGVSGIVEEEEETCGNEGDGVRCDSGVKGLAGDIGPEGIRRLEGFRGR